VDDHECVVEYGLLTSALALALVGAGTGVVKLPATAAQARVAVAVAAETSGVSKADARKALARAPYKRASLRYLYAVGWIAGTKQRLLCRLSVATGQSTESYVRDGLRRAKGMTTALRKAKIPESVAVRAVDAGFRSSCPQ
jgi:hypothetical protein